MFDAFARTHGLPALGDGLADGLAFAQSQLAGDVRSDDVRVELVLARAVLVRRGWRGRGPWRRRRGIFVAALRLAVPEPRLLVVIRLPPLGVRCAVMRSPRSGRESGAS